jgi:hypothetical protein
MNPNSTRQKAGLVLAGLISVVNLTSPLTPTPDGEVGPPAAILWASAVIGLAGLVAAVIAWRTGNRAAVRVAAGSVILNVLTSLPAFFVEVPAALKLVVGVFTLVSVLSVVLMFSAGRPVSVLEQDAVR